MTQKYTRGHWAICRAHYFKCHVTTMDTLWTVGWWLVGWLIAILLVRDHTRNIDGVHHSKQSYTNSQFELSLFTLFLCVCVCTGLSWVELLVGFFASSLRLSFSILFLCRYLFFIVIRFQLLHNQVEKTERRSTNRQSFRACGTLFTESLA